MASETTTLIPIVFLLATTTISFVIVILSRMVSERGKWIDYFQRMGYTVSEELIDDVERFNSSSPLHRVSFKHVTSWTISKDGMDFHIRQKANTTRSAYEVTFEFPPDIAENIHLVIRRRNMLSKLTGRDRGDYSHINSELAVEGSNIVVVKSLLNDRWNLNQLKSLTKECRVVSIGGPNSFTAIGGRRRGREERFVAYQSLSEVVNTCNIALSVTWILRKIMAEMDGTKRYTVHELLVDLDLEGVDLYCIICYQHVEPEDVRVMDCCSSVAHAEHIRTWLSSHNECPYCRSKSIMLLDPVA